MRSAASRPDNSAVGTPTPGTVDEPASTTLSMPRTVLAGPERPGLAEGVRQRERRARHHALARPVRGVHDVQDFGVVAELRQPVATASTMLLDVGGPDGIPVDRAPRQIRRGRKDVEQIAAGGRQAGIARGRPRHQQ